jgi:hypothetical protein
MKLFNGGSNNKTVEFYSTPHLAYTFGIFQWKPEDLRIGV